MSDTRYISISYLCAHRRIDMSDPSPSRVQSIRLNSAHSAKAAADSTAIDIERMLDI